MVRSRLYGVDSIRMAQSYHFLQQIVGADSVDRSDSLKGSYLMREADMHEESRKQSDRDQSLSRRGLLIRAGLMGVGVLQGSGLVNGLTSDGLAEEHQDWVYRVQRSQDSPSMGELMNILRTQPGGADALEKARRGGANIPGENPSYPKLGKSPDPVPSPNFSVKFSLGHLKEGENLMRFQQVSILENGTVRLLKSMDNGNFTPSGFGASGTPEVFIRFRPPADGWYLFNLRGVIDAYWQVSAALRWSYSLSGAEPIQTWTYGKSRQPGIRSFPAVFWYSPTSAPTSPPRLQFSLSETYLDFVDAMVAWIPYVSQPKK